MYTEGKIYISRVDNHGRIWLWKCSKSDDQKAYYNHRLLIEKNGKLVYVEKSYDDDHGWRENILATPEEANWLEQCILDPKLDGKKLKDIPKIIINYEIY